MRRINKNLFIFVVPRSERGWEIVFVGREGVRSARRGTSSSRRGEL